MSSKLQVLNQNLSKLTEINVAYSAERSEKINSDNTLTFTLLLKQSAAAFITENCVIELDGDYFDIALLKKEQQSNGKLLVTVECEQVSYRLNDPDYNKDYLTVTGTPTEVLTEILAGTPFSVGRVDFTSTVTYSAQEAKSRRQILMEFVATLGGELDCNGFQISILKQRGSEAPKSLRVGKDITVISKTVDKRTRDSLGNATVSYSCGMYDGTILALGDVVALDYDALDINISLRVVSITYDPYNPKRVSIEIGNYVNALEDDLYRIETKSVNKDTVYNGCRIGPENGFEAVLSDNSARAVFNASELKMQKSDESGGWVDVLCFDPVEQEYKFTGNIILKDGVITWANIDPSTIPPDLGGGGLADLGDNFTRIGETWIYTGSLTAQQINAIQGITLGENATITWAALPNDVVKNEQFAGELSNYVSTGTMTEALAGMLTDRNFSTVIDKNYIASMNLIVGKEILMGPDAVITWANLPTGVASEDFVLANGGGGGGLNEEQVTTITRHEIAMAKIRVDNLTSTNVENPIIELFEAGATGSDGTISDGNPAIDATYNYKQGIGHSIRFKWNDENYLLVTTDSMSAYFSNGVMEQRPEIRPDGFYVGSRKVGNPPANTTIGFLANGTGFKVNLDGKEDTWTWEKDAFGRVSSLTSSSGRTVIVNRGV